MLSFSGFTNDDVDVSVLGGAYSADLLCVLK